MKETGIVICNYNKKDCVIKCIQAVLDSEYVDYDIYVVDNASTDDSVMCIKETFLTEKARLERVKKGITGEIILLQNTENLGGSGGFNTGIREVLKTDYKYLMCLDNDAYVHKEAVGVLRDYLEEHKEAGMAGSKVYHANHKGYIQQYGLMIDFKTFTAKTLYADTYDSPEIPEVVHCDAVAACSVMVPCEVIRSEGSLPEDNFIYWDDTEWGYSIKLSGYDVVAVGASVAEHAMSAKDFQKSTFSTYYLWRNRLNFFIKYTPKTYYERMSALILSDVYENIYEAMYNGEHETSRSITAAFQDALYGVRGKAGVGRIFTKTENRSLREERLERLMYDRNGLKQIVLECNAAEEVYDIIDIINKINPETCIYINTKSEGEITSENTDREEAVNNVNSSSVLRLTHCKDVFFCKDIRPDKIYVDDNGNVICTKADTEAIKNYEYGLSMFLYMNQPILLNYGKNMSVIHENILWKKESIGEKERV